MECDTKTYYHKMRSGATLKSNGKDINLILTCYAGQKDRRWATLEVEGLPNIDRLNLSYSDGLVELVDGVKLEILDGSGDPTDTVWISYSVPLDFSIEYVENFPPRRPKYTQRKNRNTRRPPIRQRRGRGYHYGRSY